jgi:stage III sporulation protein AE
LCSILKNIQNSFGEGGVSEIAFYVCYILVIVLVISSFSSIIDVCRDAVINMCNFMNVIIPIVIGMLIATGNIATVSTLQPVLMMMTQIIASVLSNVIIPIIFISTIIIAVGNISSGVQLGKLGDLLKKTSIWVMGIILTIFIGLLSLEGTLSSSIDGITAKTAKATISAAIPVVGKLLGDAVDSVLGGSVIVKNAVGLLGIVVILGIALAPIIKVAILMIVFNLTAVIIEPISDGRITKCMSGVGDSIKVLFGIMVTVTFLFIIAITLVIKISNFSIMYR